MKTGLVLEGGAMRGIYTAGVLDVFLEHNIFTDGVIGVSAGAVHGCSYIAKQRCRSIRYYMKYCRDWRFMSFRSLLFSGNLVNTRFCYHDIPERLDPFDNQAFLTSGIDFYVTCTNVKTGLAEYIPCRDAVAQIDCVRASASMPFVSKPVMLDGTPYLDGGVADSIPLRAFQAMGYTRNIVVLTQVDGYRKKEHPGGKVRAYRKYPLFRQAIHDRPAHYNQTLAQIREAEKQGDTLVIRPSRDLHIHRMEKNRKKIRAMYLLGRHDAKMKLREIQAFLRDSV